MKKYSLILITVLSTFVTLGQHTKESREKITALKVAFLTQELELSAIEAQKFWPVYQQHQEQLNVLRGKGRSKIRDKIKEVGDLNKLEESEAKRLVLLKMNLEQEMLSQKESFLAEIVLIIPYKKIMKLYISEREFAKELMRKYGKGRRHTKQ